MSIFSSLTIEKLLRLLSIFIRSIKEAKRTFLTPVVGDNLRQSLEVQKNGIISSQTSHSFTWQYSLRNHLCLCRKLRFPEMCSKNLPWASSKEA